MRPDSRHAADHTPSGRTTVPARDDLAAVERISSSPSSWPIAADAITMPRFRADDLRVDDQARPHAGERGRSGGRARAPRPHRRRHRALGRRRGVRRSVGERRRVPLDHRPDRRHQELRPRRPDLGDAHRARARGRARRRRRVGARAVMRWWAGTGLGAFRNGESIHVSSVAALDDAQLSFAWDTRVRFEGGDIGPRLLELSHRCWRTRGIGDFWQHMLVAEGAFDIAVDPIVSLWDVAALVPIVAEAGGRWSTVDGRDEAARRQLRVHERAPARRRARRARSSSVRRHVRRSRSGSTSARRR